MTPGHFLVLDLFLNVFIDKYFVATIRHFVIMLKEFTGQVLWKIALPIRCLFKSVSVRAY